MAGILSVTLLDDAKAEIAYDNGTKTIIPAWIQLDSTGAILGSPGAGAVSLADGASIALGAKANAAASDSTSPWSVIALLKGLFSLFAAGAAHHAASTVTLAGSAGTLGARPTRIGGRLRADGTNAADIVIEASGYHLAKGAELPIASTDAFAFSGTTGDKVYVYEEYR